MKSEISESIIDLYYRLGREIIPISKKPPGAGKRPLHKAWQRRQYDIVEIKEYAERGYNLGFRLGPDDIVIDVDPRNGGDEGLRRLEADWGLKDLASVLPCVYTGGGGKHFYAKIDPKVKTVETLPEYPGVEFKRVGRQVIMPGSFHFDAERFYDLDELSPFDKSAPPLPTWLIEKIARQDQHVETFVASPHLTNSELATLLEAIPVENYRSNDLWLPLLMASHQATAGAGLEAFLNWSLADPEYNGQEHIIKTRWGSLGRRQSGVTFATLFKAVNQYGGFIPRSIRVKADFVDAVPKVSNGDSGGGLVIEGLTLTDPTQTTIEDDRTALALAQDRILKLNKVSTSKEIEKILSKICYFPKLERESLLKLLADRTRKPIGVLREIMRDLARGTSVEKSLSSGLFDGKKITEDDKAIKDLGHQLACLTKINFFNNGRTLKYGIDDRFWKYENGFWRPVSDMDIKTKVYEQVKAFLVDSGQALSASNLVSQSYTLIAPMVGPSKDFTESERRPVINCCNGELVTLNNGKYKFRKHKPEHNLTYCLDIDFNPAAECPIFNDTLQEIFEYLPKAERLDTIRHLLEILAYTIQPLKNLSIWVLFQGQGANGKTVILQILSALLGNAALEIDIGLLNPMVNKHAFADLPGKMAIVDEDLKAKAVLPDSTLKKLSENKYLQANPKNKTPFRFQNTAICFISSNHWPVTRDLSHGLKRRAMVFTFDRVFTNEDIDPNRARRIIKTELPGVLNVLLKSLRRLRKRGHFQPSATCQRARDTWLNESSQSRTFVNECLQKESFAKTPFNQIWNVYLEWVVAEGIEKRHTKSGLKRALAEAGYKVQTYKNVYHVFGLKLKPEKKGF